MNSTENRTLRLSPFFPRTLLYVALIFARTDTAFPMSVGLYTAFGQYGSVNYGFLTAYSIIYAAPAVVVYFLLRRNLNTGFAGVGVKG